MSIIRPRRTPLFLGVLRGLLARRGGAQEPKPAPADPSTPKVARAGTETPKAGRSREVELEEEVQELRAMVRDLSTKVEQLSGAMSAMPPVPRSADAASETDLLPLRDAGRGGVTGPQDASSAAGGSAASRGPLEARRTTRFNMPGVSADLPTYGISGPGFQLETKDEEFQLQFHDLTQVDGRFYTQG